MQALQYSRPIAANSKQVNLKDLLSKLDETIHVKNNDLQEKNARIPRPKEYPEFGRPELRKSAGLDVTGMVRSRFDDLVNEARFFSAFIDKSGQPGLPDEQISDLKKQVFSNRIFIANSQDHQRARIEFQEKPLIADVLSWFPHHSHPLLLLPIPPPGYHSSFRAFHHPDDDLVRKHPDGKPVSTFNETVDNSTIVSQNLAEGSMDMQVNAEMITFSIHYAKPMARYDLLLNTDENTRTGNQNEHWKSSGFDYLVEDGCLFRSTGSGWKWAPIGKKGVVETKKADGLEITIYRSALKHLSSRFFAGFEVLDYQYNLLCKAPEDGNPMEK